MTVGRTMLRQSAAQMDRQVGDGQWDGTEARPIGHGLLTGSIPRVSHRRADTCLMGEAGTSERSHRDPADPANTARPPQKNNQRRK